MTAITSSFTLAAFHKKKDSKEPTSKLVVTKKRQRLSVDSWIQDSKIPIAVCPVSSVREITRLARHGAKHGVVTLC